MKPRTTNERAVARLAGRIKPLTGAQQRWIERNAVPATAYQFRKVNYEELYYEPTIWAWCSNCGHEFVDEPKQRKCPHCGANITKHEYNARKRVCRGRYYTTLHTTCGGWQVSRHILVAHESRRGGNATHEAHEVCQVWTNAEGRQVVWARSCCGLSRYYDQWIVDSPMSIKRKGAYCYRYDIDSFRHKICRVLPVLKRNGFMGKFHDVMPDDLWRLLLTDNFAETLFKCRQYALVGMLANKRKFSREAAMTCVRHGYIVKDADVWRDYTDRLVELGKDVRNPHYACPADLEHAHDELLEMKNAANIAKAEPRYKKAKGKYLGIVIKGDGITLKPLQTVRDFYKEGSFMHHCVYSGAYYDRPGSLILSARDKGGKRIETVEFDLRSGRVVQSRGRYNKLTNRHDKILSLMRNNASRIMKVAQLRCS